MTNKPWGIFIPKKIQKIIYPQEKIIYENPYVLMNLSRRISIILSYYILNKINISANFVSFFSIIISIVCSLFFINSNFLIGSILACFWNVLDNVDGELARLQKSSSNFGAFLEKINSNIFYMILFPSISIGLYKESSIDLFLMILTFFSLGLFIILRPFFDANFPYKKKINNYPFLLVVACQFKNGFAERNKSRMGSFIYYFWRNIFTQGGLNEIIIFLISLNLYNSLDFLPEVLVFFTVGYFIINSGILISLFIHHIFKKQKLFKS